jgi:hypothetical protein
MHRRLVDQMDLPEQQRVACDREGQRSQMPEEWHSRGTMFFEKGRDYTRKIFDRA